VQLNRRMRNFTFMILAFTLFSCSAQDKQESQETVVNQGTNYKIGTTTWQYQLPKEFKIRQDQFSNAIETGQEFIEKEGQGAYATKDDAIVISAAKSDSSDLNSLLVSYKNNKMINQFGLEGYRNKLIEFFKHSFETNGSKFKTESSEVLIDSNKFYSIENKMFDNDDNYVYSSMMFIGEISEKEVSFSLTFDNESDRELLVNSLINSKFGR